MSYLKTNFVFCLELSQTLGCGFSCQTPTYFEIFMATCSALCENKAKDKSSHWPVFSRWSSENFSYQQGYTFIHHIICICLFSWCCWRQGKVCQTSYMETRRRKVFLSTWPLRSPSSLYIHWVLDGFGVFFPTFQRNCKLQHKSWKFFIGFFFFLLGPRDRFFPNPHFQKWPSLFWLKKIQPKADGDTENFTSDILTKLDTSKTGSYEKHQAITIWGTATSAAYNTAVIQSIPM